MSLVNQMLRDLEQRRAAERQGQDSPFRGLASTAGPSRFSLRPVIGLLLVVGALALAVAYLLWERGQTPPVPSMVAMGTVASEPAPATVPPDDAVPSAPPVPTAELKSVSTETPATIEPPQSAQKKSTPAAVIAPKTTPASIQPPVLAASAQIQKNIVPPTARQLAASAYERGVADLRAGRKEEAEAAFNEALNHDPAYQEAREHLAGMLVLAGRWVEAGEEVEEGVKRHPEHVNFAKLAARVRAEQADVTGAIAVLEQALARIRPDGEYFATLAAFYQRQGDHARSAERYQQALTLTPGQGAWWVGLAISQEALAQQKDAAHSYRRALELRVAEPLSRYAQERLSVLSVSRSDP